MTGMFKFSIGGEIMINFHDQIVRIKRSTPTLNLVPRVRVTLDQRSGTRDSGIKRFGSHFHWLKSEHEQLDRK